jgi:type VI secretion system Hcp family effector
VVLFLTEEDAQGSAGSAIEAESSIHEIAGEDVSKAIEILELDGPHLTVGFSKSTALAQADRSYNPIRLRKRIDSASPVLAQAAATSKRLGGTLKFYRPVAGAGGMEHFFTVKLNDARISSQRMFVPVQPEQSGESQQAEAPMEEIGIVFSQIQWKHELASKEHQDSWRQR